MAIYEGINWWHEIDLDGVVTPGRKKTLTGNAGDTFHRLYPPDLFAGKSVLDIGAWDGFYSFFAESHGAASVLAVDRPAWERQYGYRVEDGPGGKGGFNYAALALGSRVESELADLDDLRNSRRRFDVVLFQGVFYHLHDPIDGLRIAAQQVAEGGVLVVEGHVNDTLEGPAMVAYTKGEHRRDVTTYWGVAPECVVVVLQRCGFTVEWRYTMRVEGDRQRRIDDTRALFFARRQSDPLQAA